MDGWIKDGWMDGWLSCQDCDEMLMSYWGGLLVNHGVLSDDAPR